jgi:hypothetical protein
LDGISIQNEPDYKVTYAGCMWTPAEIAGFVRDYGQIITCPIIAAEGVGITNNYAEAFVPMRFSISWEFLVATNMGQFKLRASTSYGQKARRFG